MEIKILTLFIKNFKGIKTLAINFGQTTNIYGENATGKTTIFDAFTWLLFDKDSSNKKDFNIKTLGPDGEAYHGLEHAVEGQLEVDGRTLNLRKVYTEKWVKQRGAAEKIFSGHETNYWINEVPVKKSDYQDKINSLIDENIFKLITNPLFFNTNLSWQDRRKTLLEIVGDISDQDVIDSNRELGRLSTLLQDKTLEEFKAMIAGQKKRLNDALKQIPVRIDELSRNIPTLDAEIDYSGLEQERKDLQIIIGNLEKDLTDQRKIAVDMMNDFKKKQSFIAQKRNELNRLENEIVRNASKKLNDLKYKKSDIENQISRIQREIKDLEVSISKNSGKIRDYDNKLTVFRSEYLTIIKETFHEPDKEKFICPTCKQMLPDDNIENRIKAMESNFNADKKSKLDEINGNGKILKERAQELQEVVEKDTEKMNSNKQKLEELTAELELLVSQISQEEAQAGQVNCESDERYISLQVEIAALENELENSSLEEVDSSDLISKKQNCNDRILEINRILNNKQVIADTQKRIAELEAEQADIASKVLDLEGQEYLAEQFIRTKVDMLEGRINSKFSQVSFKMFNEQINGALVECCDTLINTNGKLVPYNDSNNAGRINAGMEIIEVISDYYDTRVPVFVDNAESINDLLQISSQVIRLIVSLDKTLRVEVE